MAFEFKFPDIGEGITKGKVVSWSVKEGDKVKEDQTIAKIETDKALADIPSPKTGTIEKIMVQSGNDVQVGQTLVTIAVEGEESGPSPTPQPATSPQPVPEVKETPQVETKPEASKEETKPKDSGTGAVGELEFAEGKTNLFDFSKKPATASQPAAQPTPASTGPTGLAMPGVKQLAKQQGIDISKVQGTGPQGSVKTSDLSGSATGTPATGGKLRIQSPTGDIIEITGNVSGIDFIKFSGKPQTESNSTSPIQPAEEKSTSTTSANTSQPAEEKSATKAGATVKRKYDMYGYIDRKPYESIRKIVGENMRKSIDTAAHVTAMDEIDVTDLWKLRETEAKNAEKKKITLTFLPYITRACITAARKVPSMNATLDEENKEILLKKYFNAGFGVSTEAGLMVVVVKRAENKSLFLIAKDIHDLAQKARDRKIDISDLKGSSFTISNWGSIHGSYGTPIINPGESAILGVGRIRQVAAFVGKKVEPRYLLPVSLSFDHRIADGAEAALFLKTLREELENPKNLTDAVFMKGLKEDEKFDI